MYIDNIKGEQETSTTTTEEETEEPAEEQQEEQPKEKTIKELWNEIILKLDKTPTANNNTQEETATILNNILNKLDNNNENNLNDFIKEQQVKHRIIINKLDNLIKALT